VAAGVQNQIVLIQQIRQLVVQVVVVQDQAQQVHLWSVLLVLLIKVLLVVAVSMSAV
jgi:hypothetical protein